VLGIQEGAVSGGKVFPCVKLGGPVERFILNCDGKPGDFFVLLAALANHGRLVVDGSVVERKFLVVVNGRDYGSAKQNMDFFQQCVDKLRLTTGMRILVHIGDAHKKDTPEEDAVRGMDWEDFVYTAAPVWGRGVLLVHTSEHSSAPAKFMLARLAEDYGAVCARGHVCVIVTEGAQPLCAHSTRPTDCKCIFFVNEGHLCGDGKTVDMCNDDDPFNDVLRLMPPDMVSAFRTLVLTHNVGAAIEKMQDYHALLVDGDKKKKAAAVGTIVASLISVRDSEVAKITKCHSGGTNVTEHRSAPTPEEVYALYTDYTDTYSCVDFPAEPVVDSIVSGLGGKFDRGSSFAYGIVAAIMDPDHPTNTASVCRPLKCSDFGLQDDQVPEGDRDITYELTSDAEDHAITLAHTKDISACVKSLFGEKAQ
jgi:hypothetical protein